MSKGRGGITVNLGVKSRQRNTIVLESSPSAEIASYDYGAALSQSKLEEPYADDNQIKAVNSSGRDTTYEKNAVPGDLGENGPPKTVYFSTNDESTEKIALVSESLTEILSPESNSPRGYAACETTNNESGDERGKVETLLASSKESPKNALTPVGKVKEYGEATGAFKNKSVKSTPKIKTSWKNLVKRKVVNSTLLTSDKISKIPRATTATTITCVTARVDPIPRIPSKNSEYSPCTRSFSVTGCKPTKSIVGLKQAQMLNTICALITDVKLKQSNASRNSFRTEQCAEAKQDSSACKESPRTQVGSAGDHSPPPSTTSVFRNLRLTNAGRLSKHQREALNLKLNFHDVQEPWSDSKSSPEIRSLGLRSKSLKTTLYDDSTSEEVAPSSECSNDSMQLKNTKMSAQKASSRSRVFKSGYTQNSPRLRHRRRSHFSFLTTLFDIVFWPFLFIRTNQ